MKKSKALTVSWISIAVNILLAGGKLAAGLLGHSQAMVADAVHSASDVLSTVIVVIALFISRREADHNHEYGHDKYESLAALVLSLLLMLTGLQLGKNAIASLGSTEAAVIPTFPALAAAVISIIVKEAMYRLTITIGRKERSEALIADAWHHRSDALSSVGSLAGIALAMFGFGKADALAGIVICVFILKSAVDILRSAAAPLTDASCSPETEQALREFILQRSEQIRRIDLLKTRRFGSGYYVDVEIAVDGQMLLNESHEIAEQVHDGLEKEFPDIRHCMVHVNPA